MRAVVVALLLSFASASWADEEIDEPPPPHPTLGISISGGVSLGAYEAGFVHGLMMPMRDRGQLPHVITGTSAGSIIAFVGALQACSAGPTRPTDSLLYRLWIPMGLDKLYVPSAATSVSALSRTGFAAPMQMVKEKWRQGLDEKCDLELGFALTREHARAIPLGDSGTTIPRMTEHVLIRLRGHGPGKLPTVENRATHDIGRYHMLLPVDDPGEDAFDSVASALLGSSGFPLAFPPETIMMCESDGPVDQPLEKCTKKNARPMRFVDGGFFDNRPIGLALSVLDGTTSPLLAFIDPELHTWPAPLVEGDDRPRDSPLSVVVGMLQDFIATARSAEIDRMIAHDKPITHALRLGRQYYPPASEALGAFFGFVDRELRNFDFYLGLYHARRFRIDQLAEKAEDVWREGDPKDPAWRPLFCLHALFDRVGSIDAVCDGGEMADFRVLARHAIERVAEDCVRAGPGGALSDHPVCKEVAKGAYPLEVPGLDNGEKLMRDGLPRYRRRKTEAEIDWTLRRLAELGFRFHDLGLRRGEGSRAPLMLRAKLGEIVDALASRQGALASHLYRVAGEVGLNMIAYAPPRHLVHILLGNRLEVGYSWTEPTSVMRWARLEASLGLWGLDSLFSDAADWFGLAPSVGLRFEPLPLSRSLLQPRLAIHGGFLFSTTDHLLAAKCDVTAPTSCSRPMAEADISVALISVLRLQISAVWFPRIRAGEVQRWSITPGVAVQLPFARTRR